MSFCFSSFPTWDYGPAGLQACEGDPTVWTSRNREDTDGETDRTDAQLQGASDWLTVTESEWAYIIALYQPPTPESGLFLLFGDLADLPELTETTSY